MLISITYINRANEEIILVLTPHASVSTKFTAGQLFAEKNPKEGFGLNRRKVD